MPVYEVHTVGGGYFLYDIFNYLAAFTGSGNFGALITGGLIAGVLIAAFQLAAFGSARQVMLYVLGVSLVSALAIGPKARVVVMDSTVALGIYGTVDNVPWSVAWVSSLTTRTSSALTGTMETLLSPPDNVSYQKTGMLFGATILSQAARWRAVTPVFHTDIVNFMENCMVDAAHLGLLDIERLTNHPTLIGYITSNVPQSLAYYDSTAGQTMTCADGWTDLRDRLIDEAQRVVTLKSAGHFQTAASININYAEQTTRRALRSFQQYLGAASASAIPTIRQAILINSLDDAIQRQIATSGNDAAMMAYQVARAEAQTSQSYSVVGISALKWVPLMKIVFETIYLAAFPLAVLMMMTPLLWTVLKGYFGGFVWLAAWDPLSAILHSIVLKASSGYYREAMGTFDGASLEYVMSFANSMGIRAVEQDVGSMAGYLMMSVPFLATVIMFGAGRMAGLATSMLNVSQGAAIEAGREGATGNISLANLSLNNQAANKINLSHLTDTGLRTVRLSDGSMVHYNADGSTTYSPGTAQTTGGLSARVGQSFREEIADRREEALRSVRTARDEWSTALNETASNYADFARSLVTGTATSADRTTGQTQRHIQEARVANTAVETFAKEHGITLDAAYQVALAAGTPGALPVKLDGSITGIGRDSDAYNKLLNAARESGLSETVSRYSDAVQQVRASDTSTQSDTESGGEGWRIEDVQRFGESYSEAEERATSATVAYNNVYSRGITYDSHLTTAIAQAWRDQGRSDHEIAALLNPKTTQQVRAQERAVDEVLPGVIDTLGLDKPVPTTAQQMDDLYQHQASSPDIRQMPLPSSGTDHQAEHRRIKEATATAGAAIDARRGALSGETTENYESTRQQVVDGQGAGIVGGAAAKAKETIGEAAESAVRGWDNLWGTERLSHYDRDVMIRTIAGEAGRESPTGQAAVAHVILNRVDDPRWGDNPAEVSLQLKQFSAWNSGTGGNGLPYNIREDSAEYERIGQIVDQVYAGQIADPTGGATHYYSPKGMAAHVARGEQSNITPGWLNEQNAERGSPAVQIENHIFTGKARGGE